VAELLAVVGGTLAAIRVAFAVLGG